MMSRKELEAISSVIFKDIAVPHISDMLEEIQDYIIRKEKGENVHNSSFIESCANENWERAKYIADSMNKEALSSNFYQDFVKRIKTSSDIRNIRLQKLLK